MRVRVFQMVQSPKVLSNIMSASPWASLLLRSFGSTLASFCCRCAGHGNFKVVAMGVDQAAGIGDATTLLKELGRATPCRYGAAGR